MTYLQNYNSNNIFYIIMYKKNKMKLTSLVEKLFKLT